MDLLNEFLKKFSEDFLNGFYKVYDKKKFTEEQVVIDFIDTVLSEQDNLHFSSRKYLIYDEDGEKSINKSEIKTLENLEDSLKDCEDQSLFVFENDNVIVLLGYCWCDDGWDCTYTKEDLEKLENDYEMQK